MEICMKLIPIEEIDVPAGRRELRNLDPLIDSLQEQGPLGTILVTPRGPRYLLVAGSRRHNAYKRLGWSEIPAIVREMDDLHAELAAIDENLVRQELTVLERAEQIARKKEIYEALHAETKHGNGPGRGRREKKRNKFASFAADTASKTGRDKRTIQQAVQIATNLSDGVKESIRTLPIADKKNDLLRLARLPEETQEAIADRLASGSAKSLREAQRALNADAEDPEPTPTSRRSPPVQTSNPQSTRVELDKEDRDTLLHTVIAHFQPFSAINEGQIAGRPAADVMTERLGALPRPEVVLLAALMTGPMQLAAEAWVAAVSIDVQGEDPHPEGVMLLDRTIDSANNPDGLLNSVNDQAGASVCSVSAAHTSIGDKASQGEQLRTGAVIAVQRDHGANTEMRADGDQLLLPWNGEEHLPRKQGLPVQDEEKPSMQEPRTAPSKSARATDRKEAPTRTRIQRPKADVLASSTRGELPEAVPGTSISTLTAISDRATVADPVEPGPLDVRLTAQVATPATQDDRCGRCASTQVWHADNGSGRVHCLACHASYHPSDGFWALGERDKEHCPPAPLPAA